MKHCPRRRTRMQNTLILRGWQAAVVCMPSQDSPGITHPEDGVILMAGHSRVQHYNWRSMGVLTRSAEWEALTWHQLFLAYRVVMRKTQELR